MRVGREGEWEPEAKVMTAQVPPLPAQMVVGGLAVLLLPALPAPGVVAVVVEIMMAVVVVVEAMLAVVVEVAVVVVLLVPMVAPVETPE